MEVYPRKVGSAHRTLACVSGRSPPPGDGNSCRSPYYRLTDFAGKVVKGIIA